MINGLTLLCLLLMTGGLTYIIVQRHVAHLTRTPWWWLWLVLMTPPLSAGGWVIVSGQDPPLTFMVLLVLISFSLYYTLLQAGRIPPPSPSETKAAEASEQPTVESTVATPVEPVRAKAPPRPLDRDEEARLQQCFPWSIYYLQNLEYRPQAVICRGQLRAEPETAYTTIRTNIEAQFGERFLVMFQDGQAGKPFFALVPNPYLSASSLGTKTSRPTPRSNAPEASRPGLALVLLATTLLTTVLAGVELSGANANGSAGSVAFEQALFSAGIPYGLAILAILGLRELGRYLSAQRYQLRASLPYFIPLPPLPSLPGPGTLGAFAQIRSAIPNRKALFDLGFSGAIGGFLPALPLLFWGFVHSTPVVLATVANPTNPGAVSIEAFDPRLSIVTAVVSKLALGSAFSGDMVLRLHPVAVAALLGLVVTALNLVPVGQLDGGHIVHAMFGQRMGTNIGRVSRLLVLGLAMLGVQPWLLFWGLLLLFMPSADQPALNNVTELDGTRDLLGLLALSLLLLLILPMPKFLGSVIGL
ncbi:site-2 protease family protein [Leptolyngbya sp. FACHB-261]|uniref:site-2 protease family protein n=1 Tax=Leptolyngbya sp. FACHB-261 TaxID=2692806 RepID=UPI001685C896|nr:site-2 protease family protein [Leptolyngbya sp. FACHB-261]MBD2104260.1 site-2 protease family protein [Leptolyngbya sp. FACHB-261]